MSSHTIGQMAFEVLTMASRFSSLFTKTTNEYLQHESKISNNKISFKIIYVIIVLPNSLTM